MRTIWARPCTSKFQTEIQHGYMSKKYEQYYVGYIMRKAMRRGLTQTRVRRRRSNLPQAKQHFLTVNHAISFMMMWSTLWHWITSTIFFVLRILNESLNNEKNIKKNTARPIFIVRRCAQGGGIDHRDHKMAIFNPILPTFRSRIAPIFV